MELTTDSLGCPVLRLGAGRCNKHRHQGRKPPSPQRFCKSFGISILLCYSATILVATVSLHRHVVVTSERKRPSLVRAPMRERERVDVRGMAMSALVNT